MKLKRIVSLALAAVMMFALVAVSAAADSIYDTAAAISSGKKASGTIAKNETADYKVTLTEKGTLKLNVTAKMSWFYVTVYDADGNTVKLTNSSINSGTCKLQSTAAYDYSCQWNNATEQFKGTLEYALQKGTYYIRLYRHRYYSDGDGSFTLTATYPGGTAESKVTGFSVTLSKGSTLQLGAIVTPSNSKVTWKSSDTKIAAVTSAGKITAKAKGTATVTVTCGKTSQKIKVIVK